MSRRPMARKFAAAQRSQSDSERLRKRQRPRRKQRNRTRKTGIDDLGFARVKKCGRKRQSGGRAQAESRGVEESLAYVGRNIFAHGRERAVRCEEFEN